MKDARHESVKCRSHKDCTHPTYHEVTPENQGDDLGLRRGVAVIVTGQVPPLPPAVREPVLPVVLGAEHPVQAEEQEDQDNARGQTQSSHPGGRDKQIQKGGEIKDPITSPQSLKNTVKVLQVLLL